MIEKNNKSSDEELGYVLVDDENQIREIIRSERGSCESERERERGEKGELKNTSVKGLVSIHKSEEPPHISLVSKIKGEAATFFVYDANTRSERRALWKKLNKIIGIVTHSPLVILGYFDVSLSNSEHSAGSSVMTNDMHEFQDCVNEIEVEDVCSTCMFLTWLKSPTRLITIIIKKLDRIVGNNEFIAKRIHVNATF
ncbi:hypothetical protein Tco_1500754 [Tanacetum coccineum]